MESCELKQTIEVLRGHLGSVQQINEGLTGENQGLRQENQQLFFHLQEAQGRIRLLEGQLIDSEGKLQEFQESNEILENELENYQEQNSFLEKRLEELGFAHQQSLDYISTLEKQIEIGGQQLEAAGVEKQDLQQQFQQLQQQFEMLESMMTGEREQFSQYQQQLEEQLSAVQARLEDVDVNYYRDEYHHIVRMLNDAQTTINKLRNQVFDLESTSWEKDTEITASKKLIADLRKQLSDFYRDDSLSRVCRHFTTLKV